MKGRESTINRAVGDHFRRTRESLGWTLEDVTRRVAQGGGRISLSALSRFERGLVNLSVIDSIALCRAMGMTVAQLEEIVRSAAIREHAPTAGRSFDALLDEGVRQHAFGNRGMAIELLEAAVTVAFENGTMVVNVDSVAEALLEQSEVHREERHFARANATAARVLNLDGCSAPHHTRALLALGTIACETGNLFCARLFARQALSAIDTLEGPRRARAYAMLGEIESAAGDVRAAVDMLDRARSEYESLGLAAARCRVMGRLGFCMVLCGERKRGLATITAARDEAMAGSMLDEALLCQLHYGKSLVRPGDVGRARTELEAAVHLARRLGRVDDLFSAWYEIWKLESEAGEHSNRLRAETVLKRMVRRVSSGLPEAAQFMARLS